MPEAMKAGDPKAGDPKAGDPKAGDPKMGDPKAGDPKMMPDTGNLAKEQAQSNGSKPWSQVSEHLYLTGNTYVLLSKDDRAYLVGDPWDPHSEKQIPKLFT